MGLVTNIALDVNIGNKCLGNLRKCFMQNYTVCASIIRTLRDPVHHKSLYLPTLWGEAPAWAAASQRGSTFLEVDPFLYRSPLCPGLRPACLYPAGECPKSANLASPSSLALGKLCFQKHLSHFKVFPAFISHLNALHVNKRSACNAAFSFPLCWA